MLFLALFPPRNHTASSCAMRVHAYHNNNSTPSNDTLSHAAWRDTGCTQTSTACHVHKKQTAQAGAQACCQRLNKNHQRKDSDIDRFIQLSENMVNCVLFLFLFFHRNCQSSPANGHFFKYTCAKSGQPLVCR